MSVISHACHTCMRHDSSKHTDGSVNKEGSLGIRMSHVTFICDMWHDPVICVTCVCHDTHHTTSLIQVLNAWCGRISLIHVPPPITHSCHTTSLIQACDMPHSYTPCDMTRSYVTWPFTHSHIPLHSLKYSYIWSTYSYIWSSPSRNMRVSEDAHIPRHIHSCTSITP